MGKAILDYQTGNDPQDILTETTISESDPMSVAYLFRTFDEMPAIEQYALKNSCGDVLDVGCGAGSHSLYLQEVKKINVTAIDVSENSIQTCRMRGIKNAEVTDVMAFEGKFDTVLLLMNGIGLSGKLTNLTNFLYKLKSLLKPGGQILVDSSDIIYMFDEDEDGGKWVSADRYYGEVQFTVSYKGEVEEPFNWLYVVFLMLESYAAKAGLDCRLIMKGEHYDYLAKLTLAE